jgi:integrase
MASSSPTRPAAFASADATIPSSSPLLTEEIARTVDVAATPQARLVVALAAVHAARPGAIRGLRLDDVDPSTAA